MKNIVSGEKSIFTKSYRECFSFWSSTFSIIEPPRVSYVDFKCFFECFKPGKRMIRDTSIFKKQMSTFKKQK